MGNRQAAGRRMATEADRKGSGRRGTQSGTVKVPHNAPDHRGRIRVHIKRERHKSGDNAQSSTDNQSTSTSPTGEKADAKKIVSFRKNNVEKFTLSVADIRHLQRLYKDEVNNRGRQHPGDTIFQHIITRMPQTKLCYQKKQTDDDKALDLAFHFVKISEIMDYVMQHLEDPLTISALLRKTGADHYYLRKYGFENDFWNTLGDAFLHCSLHWGHTRQTERQRDSWFNVFWFITEELKTGYLNQLYASRNMHSHITARVPVRVTTVDAEQNRTTTEVMLDE